MHRTIRFLEQSSLIDSIISVDSDAFGDYYRLKLQARLINGWKLHVWEHATPQIMRYAYHISKRDKLIIRWDNAPHHRHIKTFPYHKHVNEEILESKEMSIEDIIVELEKIIPRESQK